MSYQVLARKWRPRLFKEIVGQEHVLRVLTHALEQNRLHHAYLFTGTRGVGKTTLARIFAKCLNCESGVSSTPCGKCRTCQQIDRGQFLDLIEIDAASRTKVEDTREILENVQYAPTQGRYKVYLIDEIHMLSGHSFNALLKTLEEPPPHVIFLLATTDPQRLPITVLSRCIQFNLKNMRPELIAEHLKFILEQEQIVYEIAALPLLSKAADGSMRDALSLLDQAIAYGNGKVSTHDIQSMLGTIDHKHLIQILKALTNHDAALIIQQTNLLAEQGASFEQALDDLLSFLHQIALAQHIPDASNNPLIEQTELLELAKSMSKEDVQLYYQIGLIGRRDLELAPNPRNGFEMILLRMLAFQLDHTSSASQKLSSVKQNVAHPIASGQIHEQKRELESKPLAQHTTVSNTTVKTTPPNADWAAILPCLNLTGLSYILASHCTIQSISDQQIHLLLDASQAALLNPKQEERLAQALASYFGKPLKLTVTSGISTIESPAVSQKRIQQELQQAAETAIISNTHIQSLMQTFDAKIQPGSIKAHEVQPLVSD